MNTRKFGIIGEKLAQGYLINQGYKILETNFYTKKGEIDIIAKKDRSLIFIEVKTRTTLKFGTPAMAINFTKRKHIKSAAKIFIYINRFDKCEIRFDVVEVFIHEGKCEINHIEGAM